jgi:hypothetical protein
VEAESLLKKCTICLEIKSPKEFSKNLSHRDGLQTQCKGCHRAYGQSDKVGMKARHIKCNYGLTPTQYQALIANGCAVCGTMENLCIDHDHKCCPGVRTCGKCIRGVLCRGHNIADGHFKTTEEIREFLSYREQFENVLGGLVN